jgi:hypothetical protein
VEEAFHVEECKDFPEFLDKAHALVTRSDGKWIFRGQEKAKWCLKTTLQRECERFGVAGSDIVRVEERMIREFQRRLHHYTANVPQATDEWMALMQHHGAPTRLLDFTYSPQVAGYFAFEKAALCKDKTDSSDEVAIWAVNTDWCDVQLKKLYPLLPEHYTTYAKNRDSQSFNSVFIDSAYKLVLTVNPFRLNERLVYQKGVFLCPGDVSIGFMENLIHFMGNDKLEEEVIQYTIPIGKKGEIRDQALEILDQMNINRVTLFPGLDGFAQSFPARILYFAKQKE